MCKQEIKRIYLIQDIYFKRYYEMGIFLSPFTNHFIIFCNNPVNRFRYVQMLSCV